MNEWVTKHEVMRWCSIKPTTYKKRLKQLNSIDRKSGRRGITLINSEVVYSSFCPTTHPLNELMSIRSYSHSVKWDFFGNIIPVSSKPEDLINKWKYLMNIWIKKDKSCELVFSIEPNTKDQYLHSHFILKTQLSMKSIKQDLTLVSDENSRRESRIDISVFNSNLGSGINYNLKCPSGGYGFINKSISQIVKLED